MAKHASFDHLVSSESTTLQYLFQQANKIDLSTKIQLYHPPLFKFLAKPNIINELITIISSHTETVSRSPLIARKLTAKKQESELLVLAMNIMTMESNEILDALISNNYQAMDSLFAFLGKPRPLADCYALKMCRLIEMLFRQRPVMMFEYLSKRPDIFRAFARHIATDSIYNLLLTLIRISSALLAGISIEKLPKSNHTYIPDENLFVRAPLYGPLSPLNPKIEPPPREDVTIPASSSEAAPPPLRFQFVGNSNSFQGSMVQPLITLSSCNLDGLIEALVDELEQAEDDDSFENSTSVCSLLIDHFPRSAKKLRELLIVQRLSQKAFLSFSSAGTCSKAVHLLIRIVQRLSSYNNNLLANIPNNTNSPVEIRSYNKEVLRNKTIITKSCSLPPDYLFEMLVHLNDIFYLLASTTPMPSIEDGKRIMEVSAPHLTVSSRRRKYPGRPGGPNTRYISPLIFPERLGECRLALIQFVVALLGSHFEAVDRLLLLTGLVFLCLDLMFHFRTQSVLHNLVAEKIVGEILLVPEHEELAKALVSEYSLHERIIKNCPTSAQLSYTRGQPIQPQIVQMGLLLQENLLTRTLLKRIPTWTSFNESVLRPWRLQEATSIALVDVLENDVW